MSTTSYVAIDEQPKDTCFRCGKPFKPRQRVVSRHQKGGARCYHEECRKSLFLDL